MADEEMEKERRGRAEKAKRVVPFKEAYRKAKMKRLVKVVMDEGEANRTTFERVMSVWEYWGRRAGRFLINSPMLLFI